MTVGELPTNMGQMNSVLTWGGTAYGYGHSESTDEFNPAFGPEVKNGQGFNSFIWVDAKRTDGTAIRIAYTDNTTISIMPPYYTLSYIMKL